MRGLHDLVAVREESCFMLPRGSGCHWEEEPFPAGKGPGLHEPGGWLRKGRIPGKAELAVTLKSEDLPAMCAMRPRGIGWRGMRVERARSVLRKE